MHVDAASLGVTVNLQVAKCHVCQKTGRKISKAAPTLHCVPWQHIGSYFTKFVEAILTPTKHAEGVASNLFKV